MASKCARGDRPGPSSSSRKRKKRQTESLVQIVMKSSAVKGFSFFFFLVFLDHTGGRRMVQSRDKPLGFPRLGCACGVASRGRGHENVIFDRQKRVSYYRPMLPSIPFRLRGHKRGPRCTLCGRWISFPAKANKGISLPRTRSTT